MGYPDTTLEDDELDPLYGGRPGTEFGARAWQWANNVLRHLSRNHLLHNRAPYRCVVVKVTNACEPGDVIVHDLRGTGASLSEYAARKATTGDDGLYASGELLPLGVCILGAAAAGKAVVAVRGIIPLNITGFGVQTAGTAASWNLTSGKLKVAAVGEPVLALLDTRGNAHLTL